jgi:hypothetical protein
MTTKPSAVKIPNGYDEIVAVYGNPAGHNGNVNPVWEEANIVDFVPPYPFFYEGEATNTPISRFRVHKLIVPDMSMILTAIYNSARMLVKKNDGEGFDTAYYDRRTLEVLAENRCNMFSGSYVYRNKRGQNVPSDHAFGIALDFDANHNGFGSQKGTLPPWFISSFLDAGWEWGGEWHGANKDWMHFQRATSY